MSPKHTRRRTISSKRNISRAELANWSGVRSSTITRICNGSLKDAVSPDGVDVNNPLVLAWLRTHGIDTLPPRRRAAATGAKKIRSQKSRVKTRETVTAANNIENLEDLTVREVVMRYGSVDGFKRFVDSLKSISEFKYKDLRSKVQRGDLVERKKVSGLVFTLIDVAFSRLVTDVPHSVSRAVIAQVKTGGDNVPARVQKIIRDANSRVLLSVKQSTKDLDILQDEC